MSIGRLLRMLTACLKINPKLIFRLSLLCPLLLLFSFIKKADDIPVDKLLTYLQRWTDSIPQEKVYLHMDKPYYALGDTIWFKGYVTIGSRNQLSKLSGAVYVDLINNEDSLVRALKLPVTAGMVMGNFTLGDDFDEGSYRIRAYTRWMRNAGDEYFFDRTFTVGNVGSAIIGKAIYKYKDVDNKPVLTALLNFTDDKGKAIAERGIRYEIVINKKVTWAQNTRTDALGSINVNINNNKGVNLAGAFIRATIGTGNNAVVRSFPIKAGLSQTDVQFFPESGNLVNGVNSRVAFKAVGIDGLGLAIKGIVVDETGAKVAPIDTLHAGMGTFIMRPVAGKTYSAKIDFPDGSTKTYPLPKALDEGYVLSIYQPNNDSVLVKVGASAGLQQSNLNLIAQTRGEYIYHTPLKINGPTTFIWLKKRAFPTGVAQFTLFNTAGEPVNERVAFIRSNDQMQLSLKTAKPVYKSKEAIKIDLKALDSKGEGSAGNFSVAVIDENKVPVDEADESTIFTNLLLTSDLKGYIEKPNFYFTNVTPQVNRALDNLMLTQGYRRFVWKDLSTTVSTKPAFEAEGLGFKVSGTVQSLGHKLLKDAKVNLLAVRAGLMKGTTTDSLGRFVFDGIFLTDSIKFSVEARDAKNSDKVKVTLDSIPKLTHSKNKNLGDINTDINTGLKQYIENGKKLDDIYEQYGQLDKVQRLREVRIKAKRVPPPPPDIKKQGIFQIQEQSADKVIIIPEKELMDCASLAMCLQARIQGVSITMSEGKSSIKDMRGTPIGLIVDGRKLVGEEIAEALDFSIEPQDVAKILVVRTNMAMTAILGGAYIMIQTRPVSARKQYNPNVANIDPKGFNKVREFYSPRYDKPGSTKMPDLRSTVYWNPYLKTDRDGNTSFNYFNADGPGNYKVVIEGINAEGELARQVYRYTVDGGQATAQSSLPKLSKPDKSLGFITAPLDSFNKRLPAEKLYVHTDKPYYNLGDTLWFKSYVTDNNLRGSKTSGLLYVELIDDSAMVSRRISIPIKDGLGNAQIPLPKTIFHEGGYTLRAYTNWMQNFGDDTFYSQRLYLGQPSKDAWLVKTEANVSHENGKDVLKLDLKLNRANNDLSPVALRKVQVKVMELRTELHDFQRWIYREELETGLDGSLKINSVLNEKLNGRRMRIEITNLDRTEKFRVVKLPLLLNRNQNIDLQFLPESGYLVAALKSRVGFKALDEEGASITVSGTLLDSLGNKITTFNTLHNGIGSLEFTPAAGRAYYAILDQSGDKKYPLPKAKAKGTIMQVTNPEQTDNLSITLLGLDALGTDTACYVVGTTRGTIYYSQKIEVNQTALTVDKTAFPTGIARFTLFKGNKPINERRVFIDNHDQLSISIKPNKSAYNKRDSVSLEIEVKDKNGFPVQGNFSMAVTDNSQVKTDTIGNTGIMAGLLINAELKGNIETPGYYINRKGKDAWQALDNLMLTQGWAAYDWKDVFAQPAPPKFKPEKEFKVTGKITRLSNKPAVNTQIILSSQKPAFVLTTLTDSAGRYEFKNLPQIDSGSFFVQANNKGGTKMIGADVAVDRFQEPRIPETLTNPILPWFVNTDTTQVNYLKRRIQLADEDDIKLTGNVLKEVKIQNRKIVKDGWLKNRADLAFDEQDIKESTTTNLYELLKQKIPGFKIIKDWRYRDGKITMKFRDDYFIDWQDLRIDGKEITALLNIDDPNSLEEIISEISQFKIQNFKSLEIAWDPKYLPQIKAYKGYLYKYAIVVVETLNKAGWQNRFKPGTTSYRPLPIMYPQQFYSPKYGAINNLNKLDLRATLHWEPNINTDQNGKAKVYFYTADIKDKFTVKIAGIDNRGGIGDAAIILNTPPLP